MKFRTLFPLTLFCAILWCIGLLWFITMIPRPAQVSPEKADAIVVLTGGTRRIEQGLADLGNGLGKKLFISGVHNETKPAELRAQLPPETPFSNLLLDSNLVTLGKQAVDTQGNATETADWIHEHRFISLRLVTSDYHMPRSVAEFRAAMPETIIIPDPVFPETIKRDQWWKFPGTASLLISEYHKLIAVYLRNLLSNEFATKTGEKS